GAIKLIRRKKLNAVSAFIGEPTQMRLVVASQGIATVEISVPFSEEKRQYRRDHDILESTSSQSRMVLGKTKTGVNENAILKMLAYLAQLPDGIALMDLDGGTNHFSIPLNGVLEIDTMAAFRDPIVPKISKIFASIQMLERELHEFR